MCICQSQSPNSSPHQHVFNVDVYLIKASRVVQMVKNVCNVGDLGLIPGLGRSPGEGNGYPLQYPGLENSMDRGACQATVHGAEKSWTQLSNFHFTLLSK